MSRQSLMVPRRELASMQARAMRTRARGGGVPSAQRKPTRIGLWIPTTALFLLLAPFALLSLPFLYLAPRDVIPKPAATLAAIGAVLLRLGGTEIDVDAPDARVRLHLF